MLPLGTSTSTNGITILLGNKYFGVTLTWSSLLSWNSGPRGTAQWCYYIPLAEVNLNSGLLANVEISKETWLSTLLRICCILRLLLLPTRRSVMGSLGVILSRSSFLSESWSGVLLLLSICWRASESLAGLLKRRLSTASLKDSLSSKDNFIWTRTKIIVGAMP